MGTIIKGYTNEVWAEDWFKDRDEYGTETVWTDDLVMSGTFDYNEDWSEFIT
jgi:hypothetical protein